MKHKLALLAAFFAALLCQSKAEVAAAQASSPVSIVFTNPEDFTDVRDSSIASDRDRDYLLAQIKDYVVRELSNRVAPGQTVTITFKDIDMAGDYEPWRVETRDVRIMKDIYPPRIKLNFKVTDTATGSVVKEGDRSLFDLNYLNTIQINRSDELVFEKQLLADWARDEFPKVKKS